MFYTSSPGTGSHFTSLYFVRTIETSEAGKATSVSLVIQTVQQYSSVTFIKDIEKLFLKVNLITICVCICVDTDNMSVKVNLITNHASPLL